MILLAGLVGQPPDTPSPSHLIKKIPDYVSTAHNPWRDGNRWTLLRWEHGKAEAIQPDPLGGSANATHRGFKGFSMPTSQESSLHLHPGLLTRNFPDNLGANRHAESFRKDVLTLTA